MKIPKRFKLMGQTIGVGYTQDLAARREALGLACFNVNRIELQTDAAGFPIPTDKIGLVFCHEVFHWMFHILGKNDLMNNEGLCDALGGLLHQALTTSEYEEE